MILENNSFLASKCLLDLPVHPNEMIKKNANILRLFLLFMLFCLAGNCKRFVKNYSTIALSRLSTPL